MDVKTCSNCQHFRQHYIIDNQRCSPVQCGHCTYPKNKKRTPDTPACKYFEECTSRDLPNRAGVISFLTTDFLQQILNLTLPLEIEDDERG